MTSEIKKQYPSWSYPRMQIRFRNKKEEELFEYIKMVSETKEKTINDIVIEILDSHFRLQNETYRNKIKVLEREHILQYRELIKKLELVQNEIYEYLEITLGK